MPTLLASVIHTVGQDDFAVEWPMSSNRLVEDNFIPKSGSVFLKMKLNTKL